MATVADYKAVVTTEICIPLSKLSEERIEEVIGKNSRYLKLAENTSNTHIQWDSKTKNIYIHGQPKAAKWAHTIITAQMSKLSSTKVVTPPQKLKLAGPRVITPPPMLKPIGRKVVSPLQISRLVTPKVIAAPRDMVNLNLLGRDFTDGVHFCKLTDEMTSSDESQEGDTDSIHNAAEKRPASFVVHPITMTEEEKRKGLIMASDLWRTADFVAWDFKENVIRDASMVLRRLIKELPQGKGKYLKLEMKIGKVIFQENDKKNYPLQDVKFAISEFRHLRFNDEITSVFRREWNKSWIVNLRLTLPTLGYDKDGNTTKTVKIYHNAKRDDRKFYDHVWSADILEGKRLGDSKSGTLEFVKARVCEGNPFLATIYGPATSFDLRFSITKNARESAENKQRIEDRVRRAYRYSNKRGLMVNHSFENFNGYTPLIHPKARLIHETTWMRGQIKVIIIEVQDGPNSKFQVKVQSDLLKKYTRNDPEDVQLEDILEAMNELFEATEELNSELDFLGTELSLGNLPEPVRSTENDIRSSYPATPTGTMEKTATLYNQHQTSNVESVIKAPTPEIKNPPKTDKLMVTAATVSLAVRMESNGIVPLQIPTPRDNPEESVSKNSFDFVPGSAPKNTDFGAQPEKGLMSPALADSPTTGTRGTEVFWQGRLVGVIDERGFGIPLSTSTQIPPAMKPPLESSPKSASMLLKNDKFKANPEPTITDNSSNSSNSSMVKWSDGNMSHRKQTLTPTPRDNSVPPHLRPATKSPKPRALNITPSPRDSPSENPSPTKLPSSPRNNFSDCFFDLLDSPTDQGSSSRAKILTPNKMVRPNSGRMKIDFFGSVGSLRDDDEDLMSWGPNKNELKYIHESDSLESEMGECASLLLD